MPASPAKGRIPMAPIYQPLLLAENRAAVDARIDRALARADQALAGCDRLIASLKSPQAPRTTTGSDLTTRELALLQEMGMKTEDVAAIERRFGLADNVDSSPPRGSLG